MDHQDWKPVVIQGRGNQNDSTASNSNNKKVVYDEKFQNLDGDAPLAPEKPNNEIRIQISTARNSKKWTQKQLASNVKPSIKPDVINHIESGKIKPDHQLVQRIGKALGVVITTKVKKN